MNSKVYKWCAVPQCKNTSIKTPSKVFVHVPNKKITRDKWFKLARRDPSEVVSNSPIYFCEDHFDLPNDMENYMQYHVMGSVSQVRMKPGCMPSTFICQGDRKRRTSDTSEQIYIAKKRRVILEECEKELDEKCIVTEQSNFQDIAPGSSVRVKEEIEWSEMTECAEQELQSVKPEPTEESLEAATLCLRVKEEWSEMTECAEQELQSVKQEPAEESLEAATLCYKSSDGEHDVHEDTDNHDALDSDPIAAEPCRGPVPENDVSMVSAPPEEPSATERNLDPELLGDETGTPNYGEKIHITLAQRWDPILKKGLSKDAKEKLMKEHLVPDNCKLLQAPKLNVEVAAAISEASRSRDKRKESDQQQLGIDDPATNIYNLDDDKCHDKDAEQSLGCVKQELAKEELLNGAETLCGPACPHCNGDHTYARMESSSTEVCVKTELYSEHAVTDKLVLGPVRVERRRDSRLASLTVPTVDRSPYSSGEAAHTIVSDTHTVVSDTHTVVSDTHTVVSDTHTVVSDTHTVVSDTHTVVSDTHTDGCALCGERFALKTELARHVAAHIHTDEGGGSASFGVSLLFARLCWVRLERCAPLAPPLCPPAPPAPKPYQCDICNHTFNKKQNIIRHIKNVHSDKSSSGKSKSKNAGSYFCKETDSLRRHRSGIKPYSCDVCKKKLLNRDTLRRHIVSVHIAVRRSVCDICNKTFKNMYTLSMHKRIHSGAKPYSCEVCNAKFRQGGVLKSHMLIHTGEKPYCCEVCKKTFRKGTDLQRHKRLHSTVRPYPCEVCKCGFNRSEHLKAHIKRYHSPESKRRHCCETCKIGFEREDQLERHIKRYHTHESIRRHSCEICKKGFKREDLLKGHIKRNHTPKTIRPHCCEICKKGFKREGHLIIHLKRKHVPDYIWPHCCVTCNKGFEQEDQLERHIKRNHTPEAIRPH